MNKMKLNPIPVCPYKEINFPCLVVTNHNLFIHVENWTENQSGPISAWHDIFSNRYGDSVPVSDCKGWIPLPEIEDD